MDRFLGKVMREPEEREFITHDGTALFYRHWPAITGTADRAIVLFHRGHEHSGRFQHVVDELELPQFAMLAWDARGHGRSPGARVKSRLPWPRCATLVPGLCSAQVTCGRWSASRSFT